MNRAGLNNGCYVIAIQIGEHQRGYFTRYTEKGAVFTTDIQWSRAYKTVHRAMEQIKRMEEQAGVYVSEMQVVRYAPKERREKVGDTL